MECGVRSEAVTLRSRYLSRFALVADLAGATEFFNFFFLFSYYGFNLAYQQGHSIPSSIVFAETTRS